MSDPRAAVEIRVPAAELRKGDLVNTTPGADEDWQEVLGVYATAGDAKSTEIKTLVESLGGRYLVVQLTDLMPVDGGVYFDPSGAAVVAGDDEDSDTPVTEAVSDTSGVRTYLYTKYELVTVRGSAG